MSNRFKMTAEDRQTYSTVLLLESMTNQGNRYPILLSKDQEYLEPFLAKMVGVCLAKVEGKYYLPTEKGREVLKSFYKKLYDFQMVFDIFAAVDLNAGEFAMSSYFEFDEDEDYEEFLDDERWEDVRVAVCEFKKMDPVEIIFMSFCNEGRFDFEKKDWEFDLHADLIWDEMLEIANSQLSPEQIEKAGQENGMEDVMKNMITMGLEAIKKVKAEEARLEEEAAEEDEEELEEEYEEEIIIEEVDMYYVDDYDLYYDPWYDPYYYDPIWGPPLITW